MIYSSYRFSSLLVLALNNLLSQVLFDLSLVVPSQLFPLFQFGYRRKGRGSIMFITALVMIPWNIPSIVILWFRFLANTHRSLEEVFRYMEIKKYCNKRIDISVLIGIEDRKWGTKHEWIEIRNDEEKKELAHLIDVACACLTSCARTNSIFRL